MGQLLEGKSALILGVANKWSLAYAIAQAYRREGARVLLTYQGERQRQAVEEMGAEIGAEKVFACDVSQDEDLERLRETVRGTVASLDTVVHSIAFANREDLSRPFRRDLARRLFAGAGSERLLAGGGGARGGAADDGRRLDHHADLPGRDARDPKLQRDGRGEGGAGGRGAVSGSDLGPAQIRVNAISAGPVKTASARGIKDFSKHPRRRGRARRCGATPTPPKWPTPRCSWRATWAAGVTGNVLFVDAGFQVI